MCCFPVDMFLISMLLEQRFPKFRGIRPPKTQPKLHGPPFVSLDKITLFIHSGSISIMHTSIKIFKPYCCEGKMISYILFTT